MSAIAFLLAAAFALPPQQSDATIGVTAIDLTTGARISVRGDERFPMGSVYKFPIALEGLRLVDAGTVSLADRVTVEPEDFASGWSPVRDAAKGKAVTLTVAELFEKTVSISDNTTSDALLRLVGGGAPVTRRMAALGAADVRVDRSEKEIAEDLARSGGVERYASDPRDTATPDAMAELLAAFWRRQDGLSEASHDLLAKHLETSPTGKTKIRSGAPAGWRVLHKSGMMPQTSNDVGLLISPDGRRVIALAIFAKAATSPYDAIDADVAAVARAAVVALTRAAASD